MLGWGYLSDAIRYWILAAVIGMGFGFAAGLLAMSVFGGEKRIELTCEELRLVEEQEQLRMHDLPSIGETLGGEKPWPK